MSAPRLHLVSFALACLALAAGYGLSGSTGWAVVLIGFGLAGWGIIKWLKLAAGNIFFILMIVAAGLGPGNGANPFLMLISILAALAFWDLDAFLQRLALVEPSPITHELEHKHLRRLLVVLGAGLLLGGVGLVIKIELNLGWAVILGIVILIGIRLGIQSLNANHGSQ
jgi:hypothetical protein